MRIGILTGGGDVPGLNPCMKAVVNRAEENGWEVVGFRSGWAGPLNYDLDKSFEENSEWAIPVTRATVRTVDRSGGTFLHTSRTNPQRTRQKDLPAFLTEKYPFDGDKKTVDTTPHVLQVLDRLGVQALVPIGVDDTRQRHVRKVMAFGQHLRADENTRFALGYLG